MYFIRFIKTEDAGGNINKHAKLLIIPSLENKQTNKTNEVLVLLQTTEVLPLGPD